jgi:hypothetical protein
MYVPMATMVGKYAEYFLILLSSVFIHNNYFLIELDEYCLSLQFKAKINFDCSRGAFGALY